MWSAAAVAVITLAFAPYARFVPRSALAGILMVTAIGMVDWKALPFHLRATRFDAFIVLTTAIAAVGVSVEFCILIGVFLSVVLYVQRAARVHLTELTVTPERVIREPAPNEPRCDRILIYSLEGELFFGSAPELEKHFDEIAARITPPSRAVVLRLKHVRNPDAVCLELFARFITTMKERGIHVILCGVRPDFAKVMHTSGVEALLGKEYIFIEEDGPSSSTLNAVRFAYDVLKNDYCANCPRRTEGDKGMLYYMI